MNFKKLLIKCSILFSPSLLLYRANWMEAQPVSICSLCLLSSPLCRAELCWLNIISSPAQWMLTQVFALKQYAYSNSFSSSIFSLFLSHCLFLFSTHDSSCFQLSHCDVDLTKVCRGVTLASASTHTLQCTQVPTGCSRVQMYGAV